MITNLNIWIVQLCVYTWLVVVVSDVYAAIEDTILLTDPSPRLMIIHNILINLYRKYDLIPTTYTLIIRSRSPWKKLMMVPLLTWFSERRWIIWIEWAVVNTPELVASSNHLSQKIVSINIYWNYCIVLTAKHNLVPIVNIPDVLLLTYYY